ncbi:MAG TPA: hypothetical protein VNE71_08120 [Myxococcota bacterium]|jgi:hypothetical protein|nr:hypothetical protein [Myxococcota bacterium]
MPNGGSDCCGTCWFNTRNKGQAGHAHAGDPEPAHCRIRDFAIPDPFYTYCANHPHRNPERCEIPLGPVFAGEGRALWLRAPDTEELRSYMLNVLARVAPALPREYPIGLHSQEIAIWQLGELRETRALPDLQRVARFEPSGELSDPLEHPNGGLIALARLAIEKIEGRCPIAFERDRTAEEIAELTRVWREAAYGSARGKTPK